MDKKIKIPELLSPAGSFDSVKAAVSNGCDAIYLGNPGLSARNAVEKFSEQQLEETIDYCHERNVRVYIAVNIVYTNGELKKLFDFMSKMYSLGADAFIMQDIGAAVTARKLFPNIELHASTQMTACSLNDVLYLESVGFDRVILSRELNLSEIKHIKDNCNAELEVFAHGALCVCYSGQCFLSGHIGKRSGNRGKCAQPCRQKYELLKGDDSVCSGYLLSPKDLMSLAFLDEIVNLGVGGIKIEGRMKSAEYTAQVTKAYREQLDKLAAGGEMSIDKQTLRNIAQVFNRGGFTTGYYKNHSGADMMSIQTPKSIGSYLGKVAVYNPKNGLCKIILEETLTPGDGIFIFTKTEPHPGTNINKQLSVDDILTLEFKNCPQIKQGDLVYKSFDKQLTDELKRSYVKDSKKVEVSASVKAVINEPLMLSAKYGGISVVKTGVTVTNAQSKPLTEEKIIEQLSKTGGTPFIFNFADSEISNNIFINISDLNALRREVTDELSERIIKSYKRENAPTFDASVLTITMAKTGEGQILSAFVRNEGQLNGVLESGGIERVYFVLSDDFIENMDKYTKRCKGRGVELFAALPNTLDLGCDNSHYIQCVDRNASVSSLEESDIDGYLCASYGSVAALDGTEKAIALDFNLNVVNKLSFDFLRRGADIVCLSVETSPVLNAENGTNPITGAANHKAEMIVYGKIPVMTTRQCPAGLYSGEKNNTKFCRLKGKKGNFYLKDKTGVAFPVITNCELCTAQILSDRPIFLMNKMKDLKACGVGSLRLMFSDETPSQVRLICSAYSAALKGEQSPEMTAVTELVTGQGFTYGFLYSEV